MDESLPSRCDDLTDVVVAIGREGEILDWNPATAEATGYAEEELSAAALADVVTPADATDVHDAVREAFDTGTARITVALETDGSEATPYEFELDRSESGDGEPRCVAVGRNVSGHEQRKEALATLNRVATAFQDEETVEDVCERTVETAAKLLDFNMCSVLIREGDWLVPYAISEGAPPDGSRPMGLDQGLAGKTYQTGDSYVVDEITPDDDVDPAKPDYRSGLSVPIDDHGIFQAVETHPNAFDETDVELAELLVTHTANAIERIERERELQRQNERLERFASIVSHDLRNPLNVAEARLELARDDCDSEHLDDVGQAHERMETLIDDLLTLARTGDATDLDRVDLAAAVDDCWGTVDTAEASLAVETDRTVVADESKLQQLLENLIRNAVEHGGPAVTVRVGDVDDGFYVEDDGPGIPADEREEVFEFGYSGDRGSGIGLSIVREIADMHGWEVTVADSEAGGARFEITGVETGTEEA